MKNILEFNLKQQPPLLLILFLTPEFERIQQGRVSPEALVCTYQELPKPEEPFLPPQLSSPREQTLHIPTEVECAFSSLNACSDLIS